MALKTQSECDFDAYLANEREAVDVKHEYVAGQVFAMTGASYDHNLIVSNVIGELRAQLKTRSCAVLSNDMRVRIEAADAAKYPDIVALCGEPRFYDGRRDLLLNPSLVVEVLSPSTEAYDRGEKFAIYRSLDSLQEYVLIAQDRISVEVFTRQTDGRWLLSVYTELGQTLVLDAIEGRLSVEEVYRGVRCEQAGPALADVERPLR